MSEPGYVVAGRCFICRQVFTFNPHLVPSVPVDPLTQLTPDMGGDPERARREPLCESCVNEANQGRAQRGLEPIVILAGAYDPVAGLPD